MLQGLSPISAKNAKLLILGSMPSATSIKKQHYYAHPQNAFWKIMTQILGEAKGRITLPYTRLPSTSPANTIKFELKLRTWKKAVEKEN